MKPVAPPTQTTWRSNDYVSAFRLVDAWFSIEWMVELFIYTFRWSIQMCATTLAIISLSHFHHIPNITFINYLRSNTGNSLKDYQMPALVCSVLARFTLTYFMLACSTHFVLFMLMEFCLNNLISSPMLFFDVKPMCHYICGLSFDVRQPLEFIRKGIGIWQEFNQLSNSLGGTRKIKRGFTYQLD